jgi:hypothetical protein
MKHKNTIKKSLTDTKWSDALSDALSRLKINKLEAKRLRGIIRICEEKIATNAPWPGDNKAGTDAESIPA